MLPYFEGNLEGSSEFSTAKVCKAVVDTWKILKECKKVLLLYFLIPFLNFALFEAGSQVPSWSLTVSVAEDDLEVLALHSFIYKF